MTGDAPDLVYNIAKDLLDISEQVLLEGGCDPIDRAFVEVGSSVTAPVEFGPATSQLTIIAGPLQADLITDVQQRRLGRWSAPTLWKCKFQLTLLRPHPMWSGDEGSPLPTPAQIMEQARPHYRDLWAWTRALGYKWTHQELVPSFTFTNENVQWAPVTVIAPQGGIRGWTLPLTVSVHDHYTPEEVTP